MQGTIDGFNYGAVTPLVAYVMACLGSALGLRCTIRSLRNDSSWKPGWLALGAAAIGSGIWTMHFIAMMGFRVAETPVTYDLQQTILSLVVAIVVVGVGVFIVGYRGATRTALLSAGLITGLGVAGMHYIGMASMRMNGRLEYDPVAVTLSIVIAVVAATAALWAAVSVKGFLPSLGASLVMGVAVTGMHYTGMSGISVRLHEVHNSQALTGDTAVSIVLPMMIGPLMFLLLAGVVVMFDPILVLGEGDWSAPAARSIGRTAPATPAAPVTPAAPAAPAPPAAPAYDRPAEYGSAYPQSYDRPTGPGTSYPQAYDAPADPGPAYPQSYNRPTDPGTAYPPQPGPPSNPSW
ncbi:MHYT domain-containing protein [Streptomyces sp. NPDC059452]|uniref:MHYT domain-containing protein n=1 Tax=Streptomyces sp. NPDC059452 TaxID=3346835 RepID=UPI0036AEF098